MRFSYTCLKIWAEIGLWFMNVSVTTGFSGASRRWMPTFTKFTWKSWMKIQVCTVEPLLRGHPDERPTPLVRPLDGVNLNVVYP